jgi:hypothetical protein
MILILVALISIGIWIIFNKFKPFIEFSKKNKHCEGVAIRFLKAGSEGFN